MSKSDGSNEINLEEDLSVEHDPLIPIYPYPPTLNDIPLNDHAIIEASAGTGKTYTIEHLVVDRLLRTSAKIDQILVVTFTDKATSELRKRIRDLIERILKQSEQQELGQLVYDEQEHTHAWLIDLEAQRKLERALFSFDQSSIYTIHAFCRKVLVDLAFESGQLFEQELVDGQQAFRQAWRKSLREKLTMRPELRRQLENWFQSVLKSCQEILAALAILGILTQENSRRRELGG